MSGVVAKRVELQSPIKTVSTRRITWTRLLVVGTIGAAAIYAYRRWRQHQARHAQRAPYIKDAERGLSIFSLFFNCYSIYSFDRLLDVVYLFAFPRTYVWPNMSPYTMKLETWLRMADINYRYVEGLPLSHRSSEGTLPYVCLNGQEIDDSAHIIDVLPELLGRESTEAHLSAEQRTLVRALETLIQMSLNYCTAHFRYQHIDEVLQTFPPQFGMFTPLVHFLLKIPLQRKVYFCCFVIFF